MERPQKLGRYQLGRLLASGGMGEVYIARQQGPAGFARMAVVKRILPHLAADRLFVEMFLNEARLAALLSHPNIVQVFELGEEEGTYFIAMEYIHGRSLRSMLGEYSRTGSRFAPGAAAHVAAQVLHGLHYAHMLQDDRGQPMKIVHRDVSPDNVLVSFSGMVKVLDFGIARALSRTTTGTGTLKGKFPYMAPELVANEPYDGRADVYAAGVLLYQLLAGQLPINSDTELGLIHAILNQHPRPLGELVPSVPRDLEDIAMRALSKRPLDRYVSAEAMSVALEEFLLSSSQGWGPVQVTKLMQKLYGDEAKSDESAALEAPAKGGGTLPIAGVARPRDGDDKVTTMVSRRWIAPAVAGLIALVASAAVAAFAGWPVDLRGQKDEARPPETIAAPAPVAPAPAPNPEPPPPAPPPPPTPVLAKAEPVRRSEQRERDRERSKKPAAPGKVVFQITPWAEVYYSGRRLGVTPLEPMELRAGAHQFILKNPELNITRKINVTVPAGGQAVLRSNLFLPQ